MSYQSDWTNGSAQTSRLDDMASWRLLDLPAPVRRSSGGQQREGPGGGGTAGEGEGRPVVDHVMIAVAIGMGLVFGIGVIAGVVLMVAIAIRREDREWTLTGQAPYLAARGVRRLNGVGLRDITAREDEAVRR